MTLKQLTARQTRTELVATSVHKILENLGLRIVVKFKCLECEITKPSQLLDHFHDKLV